MSLGASEWSGDFPAGMAATAAINGACLNLEPLAATYLTESSYGGRNDPLAKGVPPPTFPVDFLRGLVACRVGSASNTRAAFSARVHLVVAIDR
jgi:hypothetical protein